MQVSRDPRRAPVLKAGVATPQNDAKRFLDALPTEDARRFWDGAPCKVESLVYFLLSHHPVTTLILAFLYPDSQDRSSTSRLIPHPLSDQLRKKVPGLRRRQAASFRFPQSSLVQSRFVNWTLRRPLANLNVSQSHLMAPDLPRGASSSTIAAIAGVCGSSRCRCQ